MVSWIINLLQKIFKKNKHFGNIRTKHESSAPLEWKESFWDKIKKDKLLLVVKKPYPPSACNLFSQEKIYRCEFDPWNGL